MVMVMTIVMVTMMVMVMTIVMVMVMTMLTRVTLQKLRTEEDQLAHRDQSSISN